jgi:hypothetical protein
MTLRDKCAHFDIGQRAMLFALARDVPLNVSLLASHGNLVSLGEPLAPGNAAPGQSMAFLHGANVVRRTPLRQLAALARGGIVHGGLLVALLRIGALAIRRRNPRTI